jgi:hypothetical protein
MSDPNTKGDLPASLNLTINQIGAGEDKIPDLAIYALNADGTPGERIAQSKGGTIEIATERLRKLAEIAIGPAAEDPKALDPDQLVRLRVADALAQWQRDLVLDIPPHWWSRWLFHRICVSGHVRKCRPWFPFPTLDLALSGVSEAAAARLGPQLGLDLIRPLFRCRPICDGTVEIFERVCCCREFVIYDPRIDDLLDRLREIVAGPNRGPIPIPDPAPFEQLASDTARRAAPLLRKVARVAAPIAGRVALRTLKQASQIGAGEQAEVSQKLQDDLAALEQLPRAEIHTFVNARPYLWPLFCHCSLRKVGTATIQIDGTFTFCYYRPLILTPVGRRCFITYSYHVHQQINGNDTLIYNGPARHEYFAANEDADLTTYLAIARDCADVPPPPVDHDRPFVLLQDVGGTRTHRLVSPAQNALLGINAPLAANAGLVDPPPPPRSAVWQPGDTQPYDRPWARALSLRLYFHPGMETLGAAYYRVSIATADSNGNPVGAPVPLTGPLSWDRWEYVGGTPHKVGEALGPNAIVDGNGDTQAGLYRIPYWGLAKLWLTDQFHAVWDTTDIPDGRRLVIVEVFDAGGNRLRPTGATGAGTDRNFSMLRWVDEDTPTAVPFAALAHLFWANNQVCYGDIEDLRMDGVANSAECQFMDGDANSQFSAGFRAFHQHGTNVAGGQSFMWYYTIWYHRGLNGPNVTTDTDGVNAPLSMLGGGAATSTAQSFGSMLGTHQKCTFALNLRVYGKHTNGFGSVDLGASDQAAFALEQ